MSVSIIAGSRLARPSAVIASLMTDKERLAFGTREIDFCLDAAEIASEYTGLTLRDRARSIALPVTGGTMSTLNARPAIDWGADAGGNVRAGYTLPPSYFIAAAMSIDTTTTTNQIAGSADQAGDRLLFAVMNNASLRLDHGTDSGKSLSWSPAGITGTHVFWASFDADSGAAALGMDAVTAGATGTISVPHKAWASSSFFGGPGVAEIDGKGAIAVVTRRYLGGSAQQATRAAILAWLAEAVGVSLAA